MAITVVGSVAFDSVETPAGRRERCLGGAATYFSLAASYFTDVRVIAVVGEDFGRRQEAVFHARNIDTRGIEHAAGKSFFWEGSYLDNLNEAKTHNTDLNVFAAFEPKIPDAYRDSEFLFLANIDPVLQRRVREAMPDVKLVAGDTMNYWIKDHRPALLEVLEGPGHSAHQRHRNQNDSRQQQPGAGGARGDGAGTEGVGSEARRVWCDTFFSANNGGAKTFRAPAMPLEEVVDPTGAGDSFAGGFFGYLASQPEQTPERLSPRDVLWQRDGLVRVRALRHRTAAAAHARGDRRPIQFVPRIDAP